MVIAIIKDDKLEELAAHADNIADASGPMLHKVAEMTVSETLGAVNLKILPLALGINQEITVLRKEITGPSPDPIAQNLSRGVAIYMAPMEFVSITGVLGPPCVSVKRNASKLCISPLIPMTAHHWAIVSDD